MKLSDLGCAIQKLKAAKLTTVNNTSAVGNIGADVLAEPIANEQVNFLRLFRRGSLAGSNGPDLRIVA